MIEVNFRCLVARLIFESIQGVFQYQVLQNTLSKRKAIYCPMFDQVYYSMTSLLGFRR